jgi:exonuclease III
MYSQAQLIAALHKEIAILTHLADKITDAHHGHKFTDKQRTITELLAYLAASPAKQIEVIFTGDMNIFADMKDYTENFKPKHFVEDLTKNMHHAIKLIENATEESLSEMISLFGGFAVGTRGQLLVEV